MRTSGLGFTCWLAALTLIAALGVAAYAGVPFRDPDTATGPTYLRLPVILLAALFIDVIPRIIHRSRGRGDLSGTAREVFRERLSWSNMQFTLIGLVAWYTTYASIRNLKGFVPFVNHHMYDANLERLDRVVMLGHDPAVLLHNILGTGVAAHVLSFFYIGWIVLLPFSLAVALVWHRQTFVGSWWVTAVAVDWVLGAATNFALPTVGPIYADPHMFANLATTATSKLQDSMWAERMNVLADPAATHVVQNIAAFPSLHVAIVVTACLVAQGAGLNKLLRVSLWIFLGITSIATVYFGWHYVSDVVAGFFIGVAGVWIGAIATGHNPKGGVPDHRSGARALQAG